MSLGKHILIKITKPYVHFFKNVAIQKQSIYNPSFQKV